MSTEVSCSPLSILEGASNPINFDYNLHTNLYTSYEKVLREYFSVNKLLNGFMFLLVET